MLAPNGDTSDQWNYERGMREKARIMTSDPQTRLAVLLARISHTIFA